jgi:hypothetical protein
MARSKAKPGAGSYSWTIVEVFGMFVWAVDLVKRGKSARVMGGTEDSEESARRALEQALSLIRAQGGAA